MTECSILIFSNSRFGVASAVADAAGTAEATPNLEFEKIRIEHSVTVRFLLN